MGEFWVGAFWVGALVSWISDSFNNFVVQENTTNPIVDFCKSCFNFNLIP